MNSGDKITIENYFPFATDPGETGKTIEFEFSTLKVTDDNAVLLNVDYDTALKRTLGRQVCPKCKKTYNRLTGVNAPKIENMCDDCNIELITRNDDNEETLKKGFDTYNDNALSVVEYYRKKGNLIELNASGSAISTFEEFVSKIGK